MNEFVAFLLSLPSTIAAWLARPLAPTSTIASGGQPDVVATLAKWFLSQTESVGPMLRTGGVIHRIDAATATRIATIVVACAKAYGLKVSLLASYIRGESDADPLAVDPNDQDAKPGETSLQAFEHTDLGIAQIDGSTLEAMPEFKGKAFAFMESEAYDPQWAVDELCKIIVANGHELDADFHADHTLIDKVPNRDDRIPKAQAYNSGVRGTIAMLRSDAPNLAYGEGVVKRADALAPLLDVA